MSDGRTLFFGPVLNLDDILLFHLERVRGVILLDWSSIEKESKVVDCYPGSLAVGVLYFLQLCCRRNDKLNMNTTHLTNDLQTEMNILPRRKIRFSDFFISNNRSSRSGTLCASVHSSSLKFPSAHNFCDICSDQAR